MSCKGTRIDSAQRLDNEVSKENINVIRKRKIFLFSKAVSVRALSKVPKHTQ